jgi:hypothetical protein
MKQDMLMDIIYKSFLVMFVELWTQTGMVQIACKCGLSIPRSVAWLAQLRRNHESCECFIQ